MPEYVVKAWKTTIQTGPVQVATMTLLVYEDGVMYGQAWNMRLEIAEAIFGKEAVDKIPLMPEYSDAIPVGLLMVVL